MARVGLVGVGTMGLPFGRHLLAAGHTVVGCDLDPGRVELLGAVVAATPARAAAEVEVVILSLPSVAAVEDAVLGPDGLASTVARGALVIDMSTSPPSLARRLADVLSESGVDFLDAPVSGGPRGAEEATLTIMVGGEEEAFRRAEPILSCLGALVVRAGPHGAGQTVKLLNNLLAGVTMAGIAEACAIAESAGVDPALLYRLVSASTGDSRVLRTRFPLPGVDEKHPANREYEAMFMVDLIEKDLQLVRRLALEHGVEPTMVDAALAGYHDAQAAGLGTLDYSAVYLARRPSDSAASVLEAQ